MVRMLLMPKKQKQQDIYLIAQNIRSLFNVGALFRCADVFGVKKVYLCGYTGSPPRKEISKVALGAEKSISLFDYKPSFPMALIVGSETNGISNKILEMADDRVVIPMLGKKESLNAAVAEGIALYQLKNRCK